MDQDLKYVYVVEEDKVVRHAVKLGSLQDGLQVITEGIKPGEQVIVNGMQHVVQGASVNPTLVPMPVSALGSLQPPVLGTPAPPVKKVLETPAPPAKK
jgi:multidrug efflux system membrane fusion protein